MYRLFMVLTDDQFEELVRHLLLNGYACCYSWVTYNCLEVSEDEIYEVKTILNDRCIAYKEVKCET